MDTAAKYAVIVAAGAGLVWYYTSTDKKPQKAAVVQDVKKESKKAVRKVQNYAEKVSKAASSLNATETLESLDKTAQTGSKKRKANAQASAQSKAAPAAERDDDEAIDQSTRQFAEQMRQARQGVDVKKSDRGETRVKTVKPKNTQVASPVLSSECSQAAEDEWAPAAGSPVHNTTGIDDMLEKEAPGPNSLRITAPTQPVKEKVNKQKKEEVVETKKQRQNRKKREEKQAAAADDRREQKVLEEQQRRTARIARNEPAKNGTAVAPAPVNNPWSEQNAQAEAQVVTASNQTQLLDTFDVDSNSSSNAGEANSTAATSTTDQVPGAISVDEGDLEKVIQESNRDDGWTDVKTSKKAKKQPANGNVTPTPAATTANKSNNKSANANGVASRYAALKDDFAERVDTDSAWTA
ncbi:hypothetical protein Slin15195_G016040 [Septoria linicola]|uniref:Uncharacterized protein n=1 Tax=Septoria linicola TaxID=215465 RepID=A0A9Q9EEW1_9PEZI|nr:hypothetical protein Slin14017_G016100 [Septoria linicola]USW48285.1 hypothetical protein Slin15195_G016040 [Septoria linicola]